MEEQSMISVDEWTHDVERLYRVVTGQEPPPPNGPYALIPPERDPLTHVHGELGRLVHVLDEGSVARTWAPACDVVAHEAELVVLADLPGVDPGDLEIRVEGSTLTISGSRYAPRVETSRVRRAERAVGRFTRQVVLAPTAQLADATATLVRGVLEIRVPCAAPVARSAERRKIDVTER